jgi:uncharacterized protein (TIGR03792 family)
MLYALEDNHGKHGVPTAKVGRVETMTVTERLNFLVQPGKEEDFLAADNAVYGPWLQNQPGYLGKQVVRYPAGRLTLLIFWKDQKSWDRAAARPDGKVLEAFMRARVGATYRLLP